MQMASSLPEYHIADGTNGIHRVRQTGVHVNDRESEAHRVRQTGDHSDDRTGEVNRVGWASEEVKKPVDVAEGARPKLVPRRRLGTNATSPDMQQRMKAKDRQSAGTSISRYV